jgi:serine phosphatase RsbU (regulator of sigma subunit)
VQEELEIAKRVQTMLLPRAFDVTGLTIAVAMVPATEVGGDYYDVRPFDGGAWIAIGDVSGHGLNAGLVMLMVQSAIAAVAHARPNATPREVVAMANDLLVGNIRERLGHDDHVTLTLLRYQREGHVVFAGAHEDMLLCRRRTRCVERVGTPGTWLGVRRAIDRVFVDSMITLEDGDLLVLYTDGVTEAMNARREQFDIDRLCALIEREQDRPPDAIRDAILAAVRGWMTVQVDDISLVVLRYTA